VTGALEKGSGRRRERLVVEPARARPPQRPPRELAKDGVSQTDAATRTYVALDAHGRPLRCQRGGRATPIRLRLPQSLFLAECLEASSRVSASPTYQHRPQRHDASDGSARSAGTPLGTSSRPYAIHVQIQPSWCR
jgi:hypothetical protein